MKTNRVPRKKKGVIESCWASSRDDGPDWFANWGEGIPSCDARLVLHHIEKLGEELVRRGYDINSIRIIAKKLPAGETHVHAMQKSAGFSG